MRRSVIQFELRHYVGKKQTRIMFWRLHISFHSLLCKCFNVIPMLSFKPNKSKFIWLDTYLKMICHSGFLLLAIKSNLESIVNMLENEENDAFETHVSEL